ncbi:MAG: homoserine O-acetyltransferase family protein [Candidatus Tyrphobacter sp.]
MREESVDIGAFRLDSGTVLASATQRVTIYGHGDSVALVAHALTGSSRVHDWWPQMIGDGKYLDPKRWRIVGINVLGGCYGSTPARDGEAIGVADMVRAQERALTRLGIERLDLVIGGSLGGMQALQWGLSFPQRVERAIVIGAYDHFGAMGIALNALQREALALDPKRGLRLARKIALLTYKSEELFARRHGRRYDRNGAERFDVEGYLDHQADLFERRMDARTYALLTRAMDAFDVRTLPIPREPEFLFVGISSDWLFRPGDVRAAAERMHRAGAKARYAELSSDHGHDAFLAEAQSLTALLRNTAPSVE